MLSRRRFLSVTAASAVVAGGGRFVAALKRLFNRRDVETGMDQAKITERTYHVFGVPLRTGSLYPGSENDAQAYRDVQLLKRLHACGWNAIDQGDVAIPSYLPHHTIPPIRSWPGPRIAWDCVGERVSPFLRETGQVPLLIGCDCSVVVGTAHALAQVREGNVHVLYVDGDFDNAAPNSARCQSAAASAVWLLTNNSPFWNGPPLNNSQVTVIGWSRAAESDHAELGSISLVELRRSGPGQAARRVLATIPASASILLHLDIDVFRKQDMPAAYFPHAEGMSFSEGEELLRVLLQDPRVSLIEISEYAYLRDQDRNCINKLVDLLCASLKR
ncbi:MAG: arginase family protein [Blastocatellia bacterium]